MKKTVFYWQCGMHGGIYVTRGEVTTPLGAGGCDTRTAFSFDSELTYQSDMEIPEEEAVRLILGGRCDP